MNLTMEQHFSPWKLLAFAAPSIVMMLFMSLYTIIDGIFISRILGSNALSSLNIVYPVISIVIAIGTMLATGGNAIISKYLGEGRHQEARECLTQFVLTGTIISILILVLTLIFLTPICRFLGATDILLADCRDYLFTAILFAPACMLQTLFQSYLVTAGRPVLGLFFTVAAGVVNAVLDYVFMAPCQMGIRGAALATGTGQLLPAAAGLLFFFFSRKELHFTRFRFHTPAFLQACYNGSSEMITQLSNAIITFLFNIILLRLAGEHGVAAITILLYGQFLFNAFYLGFSIGISPVVGFQYGARKKKQLGSIYRISFLFAGLSSILLTAAAWFGATALVQIFTREPETFRLAEQGFKLFSINFLFSGVNITSSGFFTALSNGKASALISFCRTLFFTVAALLLLPLFLGINGAWLAIPVAELLTLILSWRLHARYFFHSGPDCYLA